MAMPRPIQPINRHHVTAGKAIIRPVQIKIHKAQISQQ